MKKSVSHTVWECKYHVVLVPKKRYKIVSGKLRKEIGDILSTEKVTHEKAFVRI